jgi:precorrin-6x reductase
MVIGAIVFKIITYNEIVDFLEKLQKSYIIDATHAISFATFAMVVILCLFGLWL